MTSILPHPHGRASLRVSVPGIDASYPIHVDPGLWRSLPGILAETCPAHRYAIISEERVSPLYGDRVAELVSRTGASVDRFLFPAGERHKTRETWSVLSDAMLEAGIGRDGAVIALGGGVVGDMAGFVAATYMRGLPFVQVPTTLLAMVDASVGGKTGVDTPAGKNLVGAFHPPRAVVIDPECLSSLPAKELRAGLAEVVKHGAVADEGHLEWVVSRGEAILSLDPGVLSPLVRRSVAIKAEVVAGDERESGLRKVLNFGHTIGHAIESQTGFRVLHGEAVAIGMVVEGRIGERLGITAGGTSERLQGVLEGLGLPTRVPDDCPPEAVLARTRTDKKARSGSVEYALLERVGAASPGPDGRWGVAVPDDVVRESLAAG